MSVTVIILLCVASVYWLLRSRENTSPEPRKVQPARRQHNPYRAVSISHKRCACPTVKSLGDKRFPLAKAPQLPLLRCDADNCQCSYVRHNDQRALGDRRSPFGLQTDLYVLAEQSERRTLRNRRKTDLGAAATSEFNLDDIELNT